MTVRYWVLWVMLTGLLVQGCAPVMVAGGAATVATVANDKRMTGAIVDDQTIKFSLGGALTRDAALKGKSDVEVASVNGIVLLTGTSADEEAKARAGDVAMRQEGVRRVHNEIRVAGGSTTGPDTWLTTKVLTKLYTNTGIDAARVKAVTDGSVVYLMGVVTRAEGERASGLVRIVGGVTRVVALFEYTD